MAAARHRPRLTLLLLSFVHGFMILERRSETPERIEEMPSQIRC